MFKKLYSVSSFRNFIFGVEDSLVSTVGLLSGMAIADIPRETIFLTGTVLIFVEAFSMAAGSFVSEYSVQEYKTQSERPTKGSFVSGTIMFFSYFISGFIPMLPYLFLPVGSAINLSALFSIIALFGLGVVGAKMSGVKIIKNGLRMTFVGGIAITVGMLSGNILSKLW